MDFGLNVMSLCKELNITNMKSLVNELTGGSSTERQEKAILILNNLYFMSEKNTNILSDLNESMMKEGGVDALVFLLSNKSLRDQALATLSLFAKTSTAIKTEITKLIEWNEVLINDVSSQITPSERKFRTNRVNFIRENGASILDTSPVTTPRDSIATQSNVPESKASTFAAFVQTLPTISDQARVKKLTQRAVDYLCLYSDSLSILQDSNIMSHIKLDSKQRIRLYEKIASGTLTQRNEFINSLLANEKLLAYYAPNPVALRKLCELICPIKFTVQSGLNTPYENSYAQELVEKFMKTPALVNSIKDYEVKLENDYTQNRSARPKSHLSSSTAQRVSDDIFMQWTKKENEKRPGPNLYTLFSNMKAYSGQQKGETSTKKLCFPK